MKNKFYDRFNSYEKNKLFSIIISKDEYTEEAIDTAMYIITKNNWTTELNEIIKSIELENKQKEELDNIVITENLEHYQDYSDIKKQNNSYNIELTDVINFENELKNRQIKFFREDGQLGFDLKYHSYIKYYVCNEDIEQVDVILKRKNISDAFTSDRQMSAGLYFAAFSLIVLFLYILASVIFSGNE